MHRFWALWIVPGLLCGLLTWGIWRTRSHDRQDLGIPSWPATVSAAERTQMLRIVKKHQWLSWTQDLRAQFGLGVRDFVTRLAHGYGWRESFRLTEVNSPTPHELVLTLYGSEYGFVYHFQKLAGQWALRGAPDWIIYGPTCLEAAGKLQIRTKKPAGS